MKKILNILIIFILLVFTNSCNKEFLEKQPLDEYSETAVWDDLY